MTPQPSRRDLLASAAAVSASAIAATAYARGDDTVKVALVGCGGRGTGAASQALSTSGPVRLIAMADAFEDRLERSLELLTRGGKSGSTKVGPQTERIDVPPERRFVGLDAYRKAIDAQPDIVILATPPGFRPSQFEYAVEQGRHVFMEKPVATDAPGVRRVLAAGEKAKAKGLKVGVGLQRHHQVSYQQMVEKVRDGAIGEFVYSRVYWNTAAPAKTPPVRGNMSEMEYQLRNWYFFTWLSGDHIVEQHIHNIDVGNWVKGALPVSAQGMGGRQVRTGKDYGQIFDHHFVEYTYPDGTKMMSQSRQIPGCLNSVAEFVHGTLGYTESNSRAVSIEGKNPWRYRAAIENPYQTEHDVLFDAIRNNKPHNEVEHGAMSTMTAILGRMATYSGKLVLWEEALNSKLSLFPEKLAWDAPPRDFPNDEGFYPVAVPGITKAW